MQPIIYPTLLPNAETQIFKQELQMFCCYD